MSSERGPWLGVVADDVTGAVDLAGTVAATGLRTVVRLGPPEPGSDLPGTDCAVVALTSRTAPVDQAVAQSVAAGRWLLDHGASSVYQKYCSTFDSTDRGNIGPVADALRALTGSHGPTVGTPATPAVGRTQYLGHLFVEDRLLSESSLRHHPLTPMTDPDLVRVLGRQVPGAVGLIELPHVRRGASAVRDRLLEHRASGVDHVLVDAVSDADLDVLAEALRDDTEHLAPRVLGGGAGLAAALARAEREGSGPDGRGPVDPVPPVDAGPALVISGSCSERTQAQVGRHRGPRMRVSAPQLAADAEGAVRSAVSLLTATWRTDPTAVPLVHSTADAAVVRCEQEEIGAQRAAALVEQALAEITRRAVHEHGARRVLVAGGETSGAVSAALGIETLHVAPPIEPGLAWTVSTGRPALALLAKSGNFGSPDLFTTAWASCP